MALVIITLLSLYVVSAVDIPGGYIVDVYAECGKSTSDKPSIKILTDLDIKAVARCANGDQNFRTVDNVHYELAGTFKAAKSGCVFTNIKNTHQVEIAVMSGNPGGHLMRNEQIFMVSCTFDGSGDATANSNNVEGGRIAYKETVFNVGNSVNAGYITVELQDVRNTKVTGDVPMDKWVTLYASTNGSKSEVGIRAVSCFAVGATNNKRYSILRAGCGDGLVLSQTLGFITNGTSARSPYFKSFELEGDDSVSYECTYVLCTTNCDGSSCTNS